MSNIDFETDKANVITKTENIRSLADQVERLENLNQEIENAEKDFVTRFKESLERNIMNTITRGVASGEITDGTYDTGDFRIEVASIGGGVMLTITNLLTGEVTVIEMPSYGG